MARFGSVIKSLVLFTAYFQGALAGTHSLQYVYTGRTPGTNAPEFTAVGLLDGEQFVYYDSNDKEMILKVEWIKKSGVVDAGYWERETKDNRAQQELFLTTVPTLMQRFNHITGVHTLERMFGCELDDDDKTRGYRRYSYDGEDFISLDMKSGTWTAVKPEAQITKQQWESGKGPWNGKEKPSYWKSYLEKECIEWLHRFVFYRSGGRHSMQYFSTAVRSGINFPEYTAVGQVDGQQFVYYDSNIKKMIPKTEWIKKNEGQDYWDRETQRERGVQETFKVNVGTLMQRFNQSTGVHTVQSMYGCEIDDDGTTRGYIQDGYDGEDFISLDLKTLTWVAPTPQALITKNKWDPTGEATRYKNYLENECIEWVRKYVSYGRDTLERKVRPEASVFQRHSSSPELVCHATGFFPKSVMITWQKDGEDVYEDVELRETLPNQDGSFQKRSILKVPAEDLQKHTYTCVIQHSSLGEELVLEPPKGRGSGGGSGGAPIGLIVGVIAGLLVLVLVVVGIVVWMKKKSGFKPVPSGSSSEGDSASNKS